MEGATIIPQSAAVDPLLVQDLTGLTAFRMTEVAVLVVVEVLAAGAAVAATQTSTQIMETMTKHLPQATVERSTMILLCKMPFIRMVVMALGHQHQPLTVRRLLPQTHTIREIRVTEIMKVRLNLRLNMDLAKEQDGVIR
jgi:hypothetical protein